MDSASQCWYSSVGGKSNKLSSVAITTHCPRFPRTWTKGMNEERKIRDEELAIRREYLQQRIAAQQQGENKDGKVAVPAAPPKAFVYTPQAYSSY